MKIYGTETNEVILQEIGNRIKMIRIGLSMTQEELAIEAGISTRTVTNIENGSNYAVNHMISILRVLRILDNIDMLLPEVRINPIELLEYGKIRKKAPRTKNKNISFKWGDEE